MDGMQWIVVLGVAVFVVLLFYVASAYSRGGSDAPGMTRLIRIDGCLTASG